MIRRTLLALAIILAPVAAGAHVTITPKTAAANGSTEYVLRVPTEKDVPTISLRLVFPDNFEVQRFRSAPGWTMEVERNASGRITGVTWTGRRISVDQLRDARETTALSFGSCSFEEPVQDLRAIALL